MCACRGIDGLEATRRIRAVEQASGAHRTPIVALTANALAEHREACLAAGMDGFLPSRSIAKNWRRCAAGYGVKADLAALRRRDKRRHKTFRSQLRFLARTVRLRFGDRHVWPDDRCPFAQDLLGCCRSAAIRWRRPAANQPVQAGSSAQTTRFSAGSARWKCGWRPPRPKSGARSDCAIAYSIEDGTGQPPSPRG